MIFRKLPLVASLLTVTMLCGFMAEATAANVAPVITPSSSTKGQLWNTGATPITPPTATITDPDSLDFSGGTLTVKMVALNGSTVLATDVLSIRNQGTAAGEIGFTGVPPFNVTYGGTLIGSANATSVNGTMNLVVTFNGAATSVAAQALLRNVTYQSGNTLNSAIGKKTTVLFQVTDGDGGTSNLSSVVITRTQADPVLGALTDTTAAFWNTKFSVDPDATVTDADSVDFNGGYLQAVMITTAAHTVTANDKLGIRSVGVVPGQIAISSTPPYMVTYGNARIGIANAASVTGLTPLKVTFDSPNATPAAVQALLRNIYHQDTESSFATQLDINRMVRFTASDGDTGTSTAVDKPIHLGKPDGVHTGTFVGKFSAPAIGITNEAIPGPSIPASDNAIQIRIAGTTAMISLPGINGSGTGTAKPSANFSGTEIFDATAVSNDLITGLTIRFQGTMTLNAADGVSSTGTWTITAPAGVTGSGTWTSTRP